MTKRKLAGLLGGVGRHEFDPKSFAVIEGEPLVYWWKKDFLARYATAAKLGVQSKVRKGLCTCGDARFTRRRYELAAGHLGEGWVPSINGGGDATWFEPQREAVRWSCNGLEIKVDQEASYGSISKHVRSEALYFRIGIAFTMVGSSFRARAHRVPGIFLDKGSSVFPDEIASALCSMNRSDARATIQSLNPSVSFQVGDVNRLPLFSVSEAERIFGCLDDAFGQHERQREPSMEFSAPGWSPWKYAEAWAQAAVDLPSGEALAKYEPEYDGPGPIDPVSFTLGVALGRFGAEGEGILHVAPATALPVGILLVGPSDVLPDSSNHPAFAAIAAAWEEHSPGILDGKKLTLRDWLRKDFFAYHKALYENRPIYFPLSSEKRSFVAWVSIHRFTDQTLPTLLVDHLRPVLTQLDGEITDLNQARASSDKKNAIAAEKQYTTAKRLRDELADFIALITACAERGAPPTDPACPPREVDAPFHMDLDDGVMINSAALWPLLAPQWSDPKKWWKQLCTAQGKDYDWAHLAQRYFPTRVAAKCVEDPSLAVAHGCFWRLHPAKAYAWELRLQNEIRPDFTIDEADSNEARAAFLRDHATEAAALQAKETVRRQRKAAKADLAESEGVVGGEGDRASGVAAEDETAADEDVA